MFLMFQQRDVNFLFSFPAGPNPATIYFKLFSFETFLLWWHVWINNKNTYYAHKKYTNRNAPFKNVFKYYLLNVSMLKAMGLHFISNICANDLKFGNMVILSILYWKGNQGIFTDPMWFCLFAARKLSKRIQTKASLLVLSVEGESLTVIGRTCSIICFSDEKQEDIAIWSV